jgi:hypothetical protein
MRLTKIMLLSFALLPFAKTSPLYSFTDRRPIIAAESRNVAKEWSTTNQSSAALSIGPRDEASSLIADYVTLQLYSDEACRNVMRWKSVIWDPSNQNTQVFGPFEWMAGQSWQSAIWRAGNVTNLAMCQQSSSCSDARTIEMARQGACIPGGGLRFDIMEITP